MAFLDRQVPHRPRRLSPWARGRADGDDGENGFLLQDGAAFFAVVSEILQVSGSFQSSGSIQSSGLFQVSGKMRLDRSRNLHSNIQVQI